MFWIDEFELMSATAFHPREAAGWGLVNGTGYSVNPADAMWKPNATLFSFFPSFYLFIFWFRRIFTIENWHFFLYV